MIVVVTGTNTDVGKTIATAALAAAWQDAGLSVRVAKPLQTGEPEGAGDANTVARLTGVRTHELARFPEPLAPNLSARRAGMQVPSLQAVCEWILNLDTSHDGVTLVEGAGGLLVRLADEYTIAEIAAELRAPLIVVTSLGLGSLNAAELNLEELPVVTGVDLWANIPAGAGSLGPAEFTEMARTLGIPAPPC